MVNLISIITPNYNSEKYIEETIISVQKQLYTLWEWLIIDDGSDDNSPKIIQKFASKDRRIKLFKRDILPQGPSVCRNIGLKKSAGEYIIYLDSDDILTDFCLIQRISKFKKNSNFDFLIFPISYFSQGDKANKKVFNEFFNDKNRYLNAFIEGKTPWQTSAPIWKKEILLKLGGFDENLIRNTDPDLHARALLFENISFKVFRNSKPDVLYRIREEHKNEYWRSNIILGKILFYKKIWKTINSLPINKKHLLIKSFKIGISILLINWILARIDKFSSEYFRLLEWTKKQKIFSNTEYYILYLLAKVWLNKNSKIIRYFKLKGVSYKLVYSFFIKVNEK